MLSANPQARAQFVLRSDADTPAKDRPVFLVKFMTPADIEKYQNIVSEIGQQKDRREVGRLIWDAIVVGVTGWKNVKGTDGKPLEFNPKNLFDACSEQEIIELAYGYTSVIRPMAEDYRFFDSPSSIASA
jgi:hypothetical protein